MRTTNPVLNQDLFSQKNEWVVTQDRMTLQGTVNKTLLLLGLVVVSATWTWHIAFSQGVPAIMPWFYGGMIGGLVLAMVTVFKPTAAPISAPIYALAEGLVLGGLSALFNQRYPGIVIQAVALTFGVLFFMLGLYTTKVIRATETFKMIVVSATGGICVFYLATWVLSMFGVNFTGMNDNSPISIGISVFIVVVASLNLVLDFDMIEGGAEAGAPKHMEWYGAFGIVVTLVWLYLAILRMLAKLQRR